ncbi:MAG: AAA family ATPase [Simkaniaceae bacterium]|nr:AAA family ATPase [Simkaniaceae bacterium]
MSKIDEIPGNSRAKRHLKKLTNKTPHALLFEGPKGVGKKEFAICFAKEILKTDKKDPPDLRLLYPEGKAHLHPMHSIKQFISETALPPFEAPLKVFIINEADRMLPSSSNALLKTLEEPNDRVVMILITSRVDALLPTITSRCFNVSFSLLKEEEIIADLMKEKTKDEARKIALLSHGSLERARSLALKDDHTLIEKMFHVGFRLVRGDLPTAKEFPEDVDPEEALSYLFYFYRDLHLLRSGADTSLLFYQEKFEVLSQITCPLLPLDEVEKCIDQAYIASEVNIPLHHTLSTFIK